MRELIDKQSLIEALTIDRLQKETRDRFKKGIAHGLTFAISIIQGRSNVNLWIPCKKRLPSDDEPFEVYCCDTHGEQLIAHPFEDENSDTGFSAESEGCFMYDCIAWMPPFEPYKESANE